MRNDGLILLLISVVPSKLIVLSKLQFFKSTEYHIYYNNKSYHDDTPDRVTKLHHFEELKHFPSFMTQTTLPSSSDSSTTEDFVDLHEELFYLSRHGDISELSSLLAQHPTLDITTITDENRNSLLHMVAGNGHLEVCKLLIQRALEHEQRALTAATMDTTEMTSMVQNSRLATLINPPNASSNTPLHWAALNNHLLVVQYLYSHSADLFQRNDQGRTALEEAEGRGWEEVARYLAAKMAVEVKKRGIEFEKYDMDSLQGGEEDE